MRTTTETRLTNTNKDTGARTTSTTYKKSITRKVKAAIRSKNTTQAKTQEDN